MEMILQVFFMLDVVFLLFQSVTTKKWNFSSERATNLAHQFFILSLFIDSYAIQAKKSERKAQSQSPIYPFCELLDTTTYFLVKMERRSTRSMSSTTPSTTPAKSDRVLRPKATPVKPSASLAGKQSSPGSPVTGPSKVMKKAPAPSTSIDKRVLRSNTRQSLGNTGKKVVKFEADKEWQVERILDKGFIEGRIHYLIKWTGWDEVHNTWEPKENLVGCQKMRKAFNKTWNEAQERLSQSDNAGPGDATPRKRAASVDGGERKRKR